MTTSIVFEEIKSIIIAKGGRLLTENAVSQYEKITILCDKGHTWITNSKSIKIGHWCKHCFLLNRSEIISESKINKSRILEIKLHNIKLFQIPEINRYIDSKNIKEFLKQKFKDNNIILPENYDLIEIDFNQAYKTNKTVDQFYKLINIISNKNGKLLTDPKNYFGINSELEIQCLLCNNIWKTKSSIILFGSGWCTQCYINPHIKGIDCAYNLAKIKNGKCLSTSYVNNSTKLIWQCEFNHIWQASYNMIQKGTWCPECAKLNRGKKKKLGIEVYKQLAIDKNGLCLSNEINSCYDKLEWQCEKAHIWFARADMVKNTKHWCPFCAGNRKTNLS